MRNQKSNDYDYDKNAPNNDFLAEAGQRAEACQVLFDQFQQIAVFDNEVQRLVDRLIEEGRQFRDLRYETADHADHGKIYSRDIQQILLDIHHQPRKITKEILRGLKDDAAKFLNQATRFRDQFTSINANLQYISNDLKRRDNELGHIDLPTLEKQLHESQKKKKFHDKIAMNSGLAMGILGTAAIIVAPLTFGGTAVPGTLAMAASAALIGTTTAAGGVTFKANSDASEAKRKAKATEIQILELSKVVEEISIMLRDIEEIGNYLGRFVHFWGEVQAQIDYLLSIYSRLFANTAISTARSIKLWKEIETNYDNYSIRMRSR